MCTHAPGQCESRVGRVRHVQMRQAPRPLCAGRGWARRRRPWTVVHSRECRKACGDTKQRMCPLACRFLGYLRPIRISGLLRWGRVRMLNRTHARMSFKKQEACHEVGCIKHAFSLAKSLCTLLHSSWQVHHTTYGHKTTICCMTP